ncbi:MAG: c-type cytochrome [Pseudomonadota bacterium]
MRHTFFICLALLGLTSPVTGEPVPYTISDLRSIDTPLGGQEGDWRRGRSLYFNRMVSGCSGCHGSPGGPAAEIVEANAGAPSLSGLADRMEPGEIRLWIAAPIVRDPETAMPAYYLAGQQTGPDAALPNGPRLTAGEIEDLVAYLARQRAD